MLRGLELLIIQQVFPSLSLSLSRELPHSLYFLSLELASYDLYNQTTRCLCVCESFNWYQEPWFHPRIGGFSDLQVVYVFYGQFESLVTSSLILIFFRCLILCFSCTFVFRSVVGSLFITWLSYLISFVVVGRFLVEISCQRVELRCAFLGSELTNL